MKKLFVEFEETYVKKGEPLEVYATAPECVHVLDATLVGDEIRYQYVVVSEDSRVDAASREE